MLFQLLLERAPAPVLLTGCFCPAFLPGLRAVTFNSSPAHCAKSLLFFPFKMCLSPSHCSLATVRAVSPSPQVQCVCCCLSPVWELFCRDISSLLLLLPLMHTLLSFPFLIAGISVSSLASESNFSLCFELTHFIGNLSTEDSLPTVVLFGISRN